VKFVFLRNEEGWRWNVHLRVFLLDFMDFISIELEIYEEKDVSWLAIIGTEESLLFMEDLRPTKGQDTRVIWAIWIWMGKKL
jgi:hypothetical protein